MKFYILELPANQKNKRTIVIDTAPVARYSATIVMGSISGSKKQIK